MAVTIEKIIKAVWICDWCMTKEITDSEHAPPGWEDTNNGGSASGGVHYCKQEHYILARNAWENGFDDAIEAQAKYHEQVRINWVNEQNQLDAEEQTRTPCRYHKGFIEDCGCPAR